MGVTGHPAVDGLTRWCRFRERGEIRGYCAHDWSTIESDPELRLIDGLLGYARDRGVRILSYRDFYAERMRSKQMG